MALRGSLPQINLGVQGATETSVEIQLLVSSSVMLMERSTFLEESRGVPNSPKWSPNWRQLVGKMMPTFLYRQDFAKFSLNRHYN
ncbi:hypothetical protein TNCV_801471, partial [Trichonephila clavipes]